MSPLARSHLALLRSEDPRFELVYAHPSANPIAFSDPLKLWGPGALAAAGGSCTAVDGPLPFGDMVGIPLLFGAGLWALGDSIVDFWDNDAERDSHNPIEVPPLSRAFPLPPPPIRVDGDVDCKQVKADCIRECTSKTLPTREFGGDPFFRCVRDCMSSFGC